MKNCLNQIILVLSCLFVTACATQKQVAVNPPDKFNDDTVVYIKAINDGKTAFDKIPKKFIVIPYDEKSDKNDLFFKRGVGMIERALAEKGFIPQQKMDKKVVRIKVRWNMAGSTLSVSGKRSRFQRYLDLKAVAPDDSVIWQVLIDSNGTSRRFVKILPRMLAAGLNYFGSSYEGSKKQTIPAEESDLVRKIRGPLLNDTSGDDDTTDSTSE